jgi:hypothetical protein
MMPHFDKAAESKNRSIQSVKVEEQMLPAVNEALKKSVNKNGKPLNVEGYPSIIVVDKKANEIANVEPVRDTVTMTKVMDEAGPLVEKAGINNMGEAPPAASVKNMVNAGINSIAKNKVPAESVANAANMSTNLNVRANNIKKAPSLGMNNAKKAPSLNMNKNNANNTKALLANIGVENAGLAAGLNASPRNFDMGEDELKGSMVAPPANAKTAVKNASMAEKPKTASVMPSSPKLMEEEAETITSLAAPLTPPSTSVDIDDTLPTEEKLSGGGGRGGSLYSAMARTTYTLAPAAILLATAATVMKGKQRKTRKRSSYRRRR